MSALLIGLTLLGIYSFFKMGLELMPKIDIPYITIVTVFLAQALSRSKPISPKESKTV